MYLVATIGQLNVRSAKPAIHDERGRLLHEPRKQLKVEFKKGGVLPDYAVALASEKLSFGALPHDAVLHDHLTWFDTEFGRTEYNWDDEEHDTVVAFLRLRDGNGFIICEAPRVAPPYPMYEKHRNVHGRRTVELAIKDIVAAYETAGFDLDAALVYERENGNDEKVLAALEGLRDTAEDETESLIQA